MSSIKSDLPVIVKAIKAFNDNYIWCIYPKTSKHVALVDPGDADVCIKYIEQNNFQLSTILLTHRHSDHVGGVEQLKAYCANNNWPLTIYGPTKEAQKYSDIKVRNNDEIFDAVLNVTYNVLDIPGHTLGHVGYLIEDNLFCGDTLFSAGCGRIFDGSSEALYHSLNSLMALPEKTRVYCAHEYTMANLDFALTVDPTNEELINYYNQAKSLRSKNISTIPTSICVEKKINPFLRCFDQNVQNSVSSYTKSESVTALDTFTKLRLWKDEF